MSLLYAVIYLTYFLLSSEESDHRVDRLTEPWDRHCRRLLCPWLLCPWQPSSGAASPWGRACFRRGIFRVLTTAGSWFYRVSTAVSSGSSGQ